MSSNLRLTTRTATDVPSAGATGAQQLYRQLTSSSATHESVRSASYDFLRDQLEQASQLADDLPDTPQLLASWMEDNATQVGERYAAYLEARKAGAPRRYFTSKSHALSFLQQVAPTKLVDGAWLYGTLQHWQDQRFYPLIRTYLEELGDGEPAQNHVVLYQQLLNENGCEHIPELSDAHYLQGALQLALAHHANDFLPEIIGYNLGYEQLPLHLLITAFELGELDIDPYYFTLHVTVDNASTGHARKAVQTLTEFFPVAGAIQPFLQRVANGYRLNDLGLGTEDVIRDFDLEQELISMLERKGHFGKHLHSDFCTIEGRTVNEWLATPGQTSHFLRALQKKGWLKRHEDPHNSRFWRLLDGPDAPMAGVFNSFEKQLLSDWIKGDKLADAFCEGERHSVQVPQQRRRKTFRRFRREPNRLSPNPPLSDQARSRPGDSDQDVKDLERELQRLPEPARMQRLIELMGPASHASAAGLYATRQFAARLK